MTMSMKRNRENIDTANWLMMLSRGEMMETGRVFECKTCNRQFTSFQALGGHRASHKKPKLMEGDEDLITPAKAVSSYKKTKTHECSICGVEFALGQALGGHMRRHRATITSGNTTSIGKSSTTTPNTLSPSPARAVPVFKRSNSSKRVFSLDLNLSPPENDLEFSFDNCFMADIRSPKIHCFI